MGLLNSLQGDQIYQFSTFLTKFDLPQDQFPVPVPSTSPQYQYDR